MRKKVYLHSEEFDKLFTTSVYKTDSVYYANTNTEYIRR